MWKFWSAAGDENMCWTTINELSAALTPLRLSDPELSTFVTCAIAGWPVTIYTWSYLRRVTDLGWFLSMSVSVQSGSLAQTAP